MQVTMQRSPERVNPVGPAPRPLPHDALHLLEQFGTTLTISRDRQIHAQGEASSYCYRILSGCVRTVRLMEDGRRQVGEFLMAGDLLSFDALEIYDQAAEAVSDVVLRRYPRRMVDALAENNMPLARRLRDLTMVSLRLAHGRLVLLGRKTATERIASFLLEMAERLPLARPNVMALPMCRADVADHLGLTIETVCRVLAHLRRDATIAIDRGTVSIRNKEALYQMACEARH